MSLLNERVRRTTCCTLKIPSAAVLLELVSLQVGDQGAHLESLEREAALRGVRRKKDDGKKVPLLKMQKKVSKKEV